ncbi:SAM-dependent methyltransferase [Rhizohabitans arisaemae]|uniref:SAM-dependent methyltransferase n=1 Tax=Rhizohabitans arisaemae TaxID=2720610 RepID=UPI0024B080F3|nr:SAM-dependent methyltransferase [Rhizohabitans arisaemae]
MSESQVVPEGIDATQMSHARAYNYVLGGDVNYEIDRVGAGQVMALAPDLPVLGKAQRNFLLRVAEMCARQGIKQFLDIGAGIPTSPSVHDTVKAVHPDARVVYSDSDPIVLIHNNALMDADGVACIQADVRDPDGFFANPQVRALVNLDEPALVIFAGLFHLITDEEDPAGLVANYRDRLAPGSHLLISQFCTDTSDPGAKAKLEEISKYSAAPMCFRLKSEIERFFDGLEVLPPGVVNVQDWWSDEETPETMLQVVAGVGRKV